MASICCQSSHAQSLSHLSPSHPRLTRQSSERGEGKSEEVSVCHYDVKSLISLLNPRGVFFNTHLFLSTQREQAQEEPNGGGGHPWSWYQLSCSCNSWGYGTMVALQDKKITKTSANNRREQKKNKEKFGSIYVSISGADPMSVFPLCFTYLSLKQSQFQF